jgi:hypothetical protein
MRVAAVIATLVGLLVPTAPALAVSSCSIIVPAKVVISSGSTVITAHLGADCAASGMTDASWAVEPSHFGDQFLFTPGRASSSYSFISATEGVGVLLANATGASTSGQTNDLSQNRPTYVVKYATWAYVGSSRAGAVLHISGLIHQWSSHDMSAPSGRKVWLQRYHGGWQNMTSQLTNSAGRVSFGFVQRAVVQYRLVLTETATAWGASSGSTWR